MGIGKIRNMDVISDRSPVWSVVVRPKHGEITDVLWIAIIIPGDQLGFRISQFAQIAFRISTARIEISERY